MPGFTDSAVESCLCRRIHITVYHQLSGMDILRRDTGQWHFPGFSFPLLPILPSGTYRVPVQSVWDFFVPAGIRTFDIYSNAYGRG